MFMVYIILLIITLFLLIPLAIKWRVKLKIVVPWAVAMWLLGCGTAKVMSGLWPELSVCWLLLFEVFQTVLVSAICVLFFFYRDPERTPPEIERSIVSPADGTIVYIKEIENGEFPFAVKGRKKVSLKEFTQTDFLPGKGIHIGIEMNFLNVHVNRTPIKGKVTYFASVHGKFKSLRKLESLLENERAFTIIEGDDLKLGVVQIATRLVRRIVSYVKVGESLQKGQRFGMIKFGSQVDVLIPAENNIEVLVKKGNEVKAGETILATY